MITHWAPGVGDPTPVGWITVIAYLGTAFICAVAAQASNRGSSRFFSDRRFWMCVAATFLFLGISKQLDLQTLLTGIGRTAVKARGWYGDHRFYQIAFMAVAGIAGAVVLLTAAWQFRFRCGPVRLALLGGGFTCTFIVLRAASFHDLDVLLGQEVAGLQWSWLLELSGIAIVAVAALWACSRRSRS